jgi:hypothetical protein
MEYLKHASMLPSDQMQLVEDYKKKVESKKQ